MNVIEFCRRGTDNPEIFACGKCGRHWANGEHPLPGLTGRQVAEGCCKPGVCEDCGTSEGLPQYWTLCSSCSEKRRFNKADKVAAKDFNGPVAWNEAFYRDVGELYDNLYDNEHRPQYAYACEVRKGASYDPAHVVESMCEDTYEDFEVEDEDELYAFFEKWNAKQDQAWWESTSTVVLLEWPLETILESVTEQDSERLQE